MVRCVPGCRRAQGGPPGRVRDRPVPGNHPGQPITPDWLAARIANHGLPADTLRANALLELAAEVPAAFLADLLGISAQTAVRWAQASGGEWTNYAATTTRQHRATHA